MYVNAVRRIRRWCGHVARAVAERLDVPFIDRQFQRRSPRTWGADRDAPVP